MSVLLIEVRSKTLMDDFRWKIESFTIIGFYYYEYMASPFDYHQSFFYVSFHWTIVF